MKITSYIIVATITTLSFLAVTASDAAAQDGYGYGAGYATQQQAAPQAADRNYVVPPSYQGQYYPQETQSATGYYGTTNTSDNRVNYTEEDPYFYYYY